MLALLWVYPWFFTLCFTRGIVSGDSLYPLRGSLHGTSFHIKRNTSFAVQPYFYMRTVCWHPWNSKCLSPGSGWNPLKRHLSLRLCELASRVPVNTVTMLMLAQVNTFPFKLLLNTPQCTQSKLYMTTVCWGKFECLYHHFRSQTTAEFL